MSRDLDDEVAAWSAETRRIKFPRRDWKTVRRLAVVTVGLLLGSLVLGNALGLHDLATVCLTGGGLFGAAFLAWFRLPRLYVELPPSA